MDVRRGTTGAMGKEDLHWNNPLQLADFRCKYFFRVYGYLCGQHLIVGLVAYIVTMNDAVRESLEKNAVYSVAFIFLGLISYGLLYVKSLNHPDKSMACALMQVQFTVFMSLLAGFVSCTFAFYSVIFMCLQISLSCLVISLGYRYFSFEYHQLHGIRFIFYLQSLISGTMMVTMINLSLPDRDLTIYVNNCLDGLILSTILLMYYAYGTVRLTGTRFIRFKQENFLFGATLVYTTAILKIYYKKKK